ncbi:MAG: hypothetical protein ACE5JA_07230 [bacterium]
MRGRLMNGARIAGAVVCATGLLYSLPLFADAPYEKYHVTYEEVSKDALKGIIGVLTISSRSKGNKELRTYSKADKEFTYEKNLQIRTETTPVSNFGYHPSIDKWHIESYRYPIVALSGEYLRIVYEPRKNLRAWICVKEVGEKFRASIVRLDSVETPSPFFVDIFYFTESGKRKVYERPDNKADFKVISRDEKRWWLQRIVDQRGEFVKIANIQVDFESYKETIQPIGWVGIWDEQGRLTIWIKNVDLC